MRSRTDSKNFQLAGDGVPVQIPAMAQFRAPRNRHRTYIQTLLDGDRRLVEGWMLEQSYKALVPSPILSGMSHLACVAPGPGHQTQLGRTGYWFCRSQAIPRV